MENLDLRLSMCSIFQKGWWKKCLGLFGIYLLPFIGIFLGIGIIGIGVILKNMPIFIVMALLGICVTLVSFIVYILAELFIYGYFMLYGHDIALDKNALYRSVFSKETFKEGLIAGAKSLIAGFVMIPFFLIMLPFIIISAVINSEIAFYAVCLLGFLMFAVPTTKIMSYFIKDMDIASLFHWGNAFGYSKSVKGAFWVVAFPLLAGAALMAVIFCSSVVLAPLANKTVIDNVILNIATVLVSYILYAFYFNLLGQYTYAVIKQKEGVEPETLPKEPKNDNAAIIIAIAICVFLLMSVLGVVAALTIPSLVNRNNDIAAKVRIKKAISSYEMAAAAYMAENSTDKNPVTNLTKFAGENCENLEEYFKIVNKYDKCAFTTTDGVYWLFDPEDGSVNVSDSYESPKYNITLGICKNGEINCKEEFPDAAEMLRK